MKIYLTRHGQTAWNAEHKTQGHTDISLNEIGIKQAEELRDKIKSLEFDMVYSSPLRRAAETAKIAVNGGHEVIFDDRLKERCFGEFEGQVITTWPALGNCVNIDDFDLNEIAGNVETIKHLITRAQDFLNDLKRKHDNNTKILVVTHGAMSKALNWVLTQPNENKFSDFHLDNAEIKEYEI